MSQHTIVIECPEPWDADRVEDAVYAALTVAGVQIDEYHRERMLEDPDEHTAGDAPAIPTDSPTARRARGLEPIRPARRQQS